jgi:hypothetical protein
MAVYRPKIIIRKNVKIHDKSNGHIRVIPKLAPADAMVVILPVPMLYPIKNNPGAIDAKNKPIFFHIGFNY